MSTQSSFFSTDHDDDHYATSHAGERALNRAIVTAEISRSYEEYLEIFDKFCANDIEVSSDTSTGQIRGKTRVSSLLYDFLVPLHIMAEIGGCQSPPDKARCLVMLRVKHIQSGYSTSLSGLSKSSYARCK